MKMEIMSKKTITLIPGASFEELQSYMPENMEYVETGNDEYGLIGIFK